MHQLYILFESAAGYALFRTSEFEEIGSFIPQVRRSILDASKFRSIILLNAFYSFNNPTEALESIKLISEGKLPKDLQLFLESNVPRSKKARQPVVLGVQEEVLASSISETLNIVCTASGPVLEIVRGIRIHFPKLVKTYKTLEKIIKSQISLGHNYCRSKLKFTVEKSDCMIPQNLKTLELLEKDIHTLVKRVREWYSFHFPELIKIVSKEEQFIKCVKEIGDRKTISNDIEARLNAVLNDEHKVQSILNAVSCSMGMDISPEDVDNIRNFIEQILSLITRREQVFDYLKAKMNSIAPNLSSLLGEMVGAELISQAGSLLNLSKLPASTIQVLGAKKSLFRSMKMKGKVVSKFGALDKKSTIIGKSPKAIRSHRILANKCCLAARFDCFSAKPDPSFGAILKKEAEDKVKFYTKLRNKSVK